MDTNTPVQNKKTLTQKQQWHESPFREYFNLLSDIDKNQRYSEEYGSIMILSLMEEVGEMARAYLAEHGRKKLNLSAQQDESYQQELGDLLVTILRFARVKNINLHERIMYSLTKILERKKTPKGAISKDLQNTARYDAIKL